MRSQHSRTSRAESSGAFACAVALLCIQTSVARADIAPSERAVLDALYQNTGGAGWASWRRRPHAIRWVGSSPRDRVQLVRRSLRCVQEPCREHHAGQQSSGRRPLPALNMLTHLQSFYVYNNQLTGPIPDLTGLGALQVLFAYNNQLSGAIPPFERNRPKWATGFQRQQQPIDRIDSGTEWCPRAVVFLRRSQSPDGVGARSQRIDAPDQFQRREQRSRRTDFGAQRQSQISMGGQQSSQRKHSRSRRPHESAFLLRQRQRVERVDSPGRHALKPAAIPCREQPAHRSAAGSAKPQQSDPRRSSLCPNRLDELTSPGWMRQRATHLGTTCAK